jgi:sugar phosphate permease
VSGSSLADAAGARVSARLVALVFVPFAAGFFLSYFFRNVNAVIAKDLVREFALTPADLGLLTSAYFMAFGLAMLPLGVFLDRYGPRRVVATLLCITALGAFVFGAARDFGTPAAGRALIGLGVSACLMGAIKAFTLWFPPRASPRSTAGISSSAASAGSPRPRRWKPRSGRSAGARCSTASPRRRSRSPP